MKNISTLTLVTLFSFLIATEGCDEVIQESDKNSRDSSFISYKEINKRPFSSSEAIYEPDLKPDVSESSQLQIIPSTARSSDQRSLVLLNNRLRMVIDGKRVTFPPKLNPGRYQLLITPVDATENTYQDAPTVGYELSQVDKKWQISESEPYGVWINYIEQDGSEVVVDYFTTTRQDVEGGQVRIYVNDKFLVAHSIAKRLEISGLKDGKHKIGFQMVTSKGDPITHPYSRIEKMIDFRSE